MAGRFWIKPGITITQDIFLDYDLVAVTWSVNEVTIEDKYEINLNITYETNVPAAVVVIEPGGVNLPTMKPGDVFSGEFTITNHGLIRADNVAFTLPASNQYFKYELLLDAVPTSLAAKQVVVVPYRVTMLSAPGQPANGAATGGGCWSYDNGTRVTYNYACTNGTVTNGSSVFSWSYRESTTCGTTHCCGGGGGSVNPQGGVYSYGGGGGYGGGSSYVPAYQSLSGLPVCMPDCPDGTCGTAGDNGGGER